MALQEHKIVYRQQMETANLETGEINREFMEACYSVIVIDTETGKKFVTNEKGIIKINLNDYPELKNDVEAFVPKFIAAFEAEYQKEKTRINQSANAPVINSLNTTGDNQEASNPLPDVTQS